MTAHDVACDVLVVGGGPAGIVTAMLLGDFGVDCLVVEKRTEVSSLPRARGIHARATEILRQLGVEPDMVASALPVRPEMQMRGPIDQPPTAVVTTGGEEFVEVSPCEGIAISQDLFEGVLRRHLTRRPGVDLRLGAAVTDLDVEPDGSVRATVYDGSAGSTFRVHASYLVAADGWRSSVRSNVGIGYVGDETVATMRGVRFRADLTPWLGDPPPALVQLTDVAGILLPTHPDHRWVTMRQLGPDGPGPAATTDFVRDQLGVDVPIEPLGDSDITVGIQWAETMQRGRVFLVGDAGHRVTPAGATGISSAMADAHNLAWKLAAALRGWAGPELVESYADERGAVTRALCAGNRVLWKSRAGGAAVDLRTFDMGYRYRSAVICDGDARPVLDMDEPYLPNAEPGARAPHAWLDDRRERSVLDEFGHGFVLICRTGSPWPKAADQYRGPIPLSVLATERAEVLEAYGIGSGAVLVRPDGHVAWRTREDHDPGAALQHALVIASGGVSA